jgi:uncharacterized protein YyaL (SSP411 family)
MAEGATVMDTQKRKRLPTLNLQQTPPIDRHQKYYRPTSSRTFPPTHPPIREAFAVSSLLRLAQQLPILSGTIHGGCVEQTAMDGEHQLQPAESQAQPGISATPHHTNRLIDATSPYLLQHAHNPVDWQPWGKEALEQARREDKPIFLSIGYSACHWCHVMEREVFEKQDIANIMNVHFINIKVDREERPDLDELYMLATQVMSGSGGWPMSVWLTPDLKPFYAGTYFPPQDAHGRPGFPRLELALADAWKNRRAELLAQSERVVEAIKTHADESSDSAAGVVDLQAWLGTAIEQAADRFDDTYGGLGSAPKFPPHQALHLWLSMLRTPVAATLSDQDATVLQHMTTKTLDAMMRGGIYDHVGGAFARYSTDERWLVPHFEKMLYDNAQLAPAYALAAVQFGRPDYARIARQTLDFWLRDMRAPDGSLYSTLDADSEGAEGKYYVWTLADLRSTFADPQDVQLLVEHFGLTPEGNWHESPVEKASVLAIDKTVDQLTQTGQTPDAVQKRIDTLLGQLRTVRRTRVPPGLDDKIITSWNGLMISALAIAGRVLREPKYLEAAHRAIGFILTHHMEAGRKLLRVSRHKKAHTDAFLEDHAFLLNGLMDLIDSTTPTSLPGTMARKRALELADTLIRDFGDPERGGFFFTAPSRDTLFARMKNAADNAVPSANALAIRALLRLAQSSGKEQYREVAMKAVQAFAANIQRRPDFFPTILQSLLEDEEATRAAKFGAAAATRATVGAGQSPLPFVDLPLALDHAAIAKTPLLSLTVAPISPVTARDSSSFDIALDLTVASGYHLQPHVPKDQEAFATVVRIRGDVPLATQEWKYPGDDSPYAGTIRFTARCSIARAVKPGRYMLRATVLAQPCSDASCLPPEKVSIDLPLEVIA